MLQMPSKQEQVSINPYPWLRVPDQCEDPFSLEPWISNDDELRTSPKMTSAFRSFAPSSAEKRDFCMSLLNRQQQDTLNQPNKAVDSWSPQRSNDPLCGFRASMQNGSLSSSGSTESVDAAAAATTTATTSTTWSAVVQKNPRPIKYRKSKPAKMFTVTLAACCAMPRIKLTCGSCNEEAHVKVKEEMKPRVIPVSTSQLGFCRFCQTNGDPPEIYQAHSLRSDEGKVTCPVLREYNCPICNNGGGDFAHTIKYCPMARRVKPTN